MNTTHSLKTTLLTAAAAVLCTGVQFTSIDSLAAARTASVGAHVVQLPAVLITARREPMTLAVQQLPQMVIVARRADGVRTVTAQATARPAI